MPPIVPVLASKSPHIPHVFPSCRAAIQAEDNSLKLSPVRSAAVLVVDGLGKAQLAARSGYARFLNRTMVGASGVTSASTVFPSTTAAALASLTTGAWPGQHGMVGYAVLDPKGNRLVNQLNGWDAGMDPAHWQRCPTVFEQVADTLPSVVVGPERYRDSGFTGAVLRGARYVAARSMLERVQRTVQLMAEGPVLVYTYFPELDQAGHSHGWQSERWSAELEELDGVIAVFARSIRSTDGALLTADHGMVDVAAHEQVVLPAESALFEGVRHLGGEPRGLQLYCEPDADQTHRQRLLTAWREQEGSRAWVLSRAEAVQADLFGAVDAEVLPRIGDILVLARKRIAYYRDDAKPSSRQMIGQHGSLSPEEMTVPLLRFGRWG